MKKVLKRMSFHIFHINEWVHDEWPSGLCKEVSLCRVLRPTINIMRNRNPGGFPISSLQ